MITMTTPLQTPHDVPPPEVAPTAADAAPGIPYRAMATLFRAAQEQAQLIAPPLLRALALDERIGADPHLRCAQRLLRELQAELDAELDAVYMSAHMPMPHGS